MFERWNFTVCSVTQSIRASSRFEWPSATSATISRSLRVSASPSSSSTARTGGRGLAASSFVVAVFAVAPTRAYLVQRSELQGLQRQADQLQQQNTELERRIADLNDPSTLERLARECLGMVKPGEIAFVPIPKGGAPTLPDCG